MEGNNKLQEQIKMLRKQKPFKNLPEDFVQIVSRDENSFESDDDVVPINSIVMQVQSDKGLLETILVIVAETDKIDLAKVKAHWQSKIQSTEPIINIQLAPSEQLETLVGFPPGCIPPIGHEVANKHKVIPTILDDSLIQNTARRKLLGGGGHEQLRSLVRLTALVGMDHVEIAKISLEKEDGPNDEEFDELPPNLPQRVISLPPWGSSARPKPLFPVEPPDLEKARALLEAHSDQERLPPAVAEDTIWITVMGKIAGVRRMSKRLVFCDFVPPGYELPDKTESQELVVDSDAFKIPKEWRSATDGEELSVQLIGGKTMCQAMGEVQGQEALKRLRVGQAVMIQAKINAYNSKDSLERWVSERRLDLALVTYQVLYDKPVPSGPQGFAPMALAPRGKPSKPYLKWKDVFGPAGESDDSSQYITIVDDEASAENFAEDVSKLLQSLHSDDGLPNGNVPVNGESTNDDESVSSSVSTSTSPTEDYTLIGIDCEWKPNFYLNNPQDKQPVLLLQINIQQRVYLLDLQTLLRPLLASDDSMISTEQLVNKAVRSLFISRRLIKVGFQLLQDLQKLAASYPHAPAFQQINGILETATIAKKVMHTKKHKNVRHVTSSLNRISEHFLNRSIDKQMQVSDWSQRPLTQEQIDYAAMDSAITPALMRLCLEELQVFVFPPKPELGRWKGDVSYQKMLTSCKFLFLQPETDAHIIKKLKAKPILRNHPLHLVTQMWVTGETPPSLPSVEVNDRDGPYTDAFGILRVPSTYVRIKPKQLQCWDDFGASLTGQKTGKSKEKCLQALLTESVQDDPMMLPEGSRIDYPPRSGFVEFEDGVALFVNMPEKSSSNSGQPRSYPNEWLEGGKILTWFIRDYEWKGGTTSLAKKLKDQSSFVVLFVRVTRKNYFLCCGRCRVEEPESTTDIVSKEDQDNWYLKQINLHLLDWNKLSQTDEFITLVE